MIQTELIALDKLFEDVQMNRVFPDGKTFVDCSPKINAEEIMKKYHSQKNAKGFNLEQFVKSHFELPIPHSDNYHSDQTRPIVENIDQLWTVLTRAPDKTGGTLIALPHPYIVPGGRFGEIYYWDSYFTMLGLKTSGKNDMVENMVNNFSFLIDTIGYIPNGNRSYFLGRSQPPFYAQMVKLLAKINGKEVLIKKLPQLLKEYQFWMKGSVHLNRNTPMVMHTALMPGGETLNRYWDDNDVPRPESYREDVETAKEGSMLAPITYRHLRAGAESGWDFSSRWFEDGKTLASIHTTDIIPVDLNCLLWNLETTIAEASAYNNDKQTQENFSERAAARKTAIDRYCWNDKVGFYFDYDLVKKEQTGTWSLAAMFPLYFHICTDEQARRIGENIRSKFLNDGGVVSTLNVTGEQWDAPNGWAPLHWITIRGLENYGLGELASEIAGRWIKLNTEVFKRTGKLMEKYNVVDTHLEAGGGEYEGQDGFGWTNGVLVTLMEKYGG